MLTCSSVDYSGIDKVWDTITEYIEYIKGTGFFEKQRMKQARYWMYESIHEALHDHFYNQKGIQDKLRLFEEKVVDANTPKIFIDRNRCVLCKRCVRSIKSKDGKSIFAIKGRGHTAMINMSQAYLITGVFMVHLKKHFKHQPYTWITKSRCLSLNLD